MKEVLRTTTDKGYRLQKLSDTLMLAVELKRICLDEMERLKTGNGKEA
jgi:hypothetical protein